MREPNDEYNMHFDDMDKDGGVLIVRYAPTSKYFLFDVSASAGQTKVSIHIDDLRPSLRTLVEHRRKAVNVFNYETYGNSSAVGVCDLRVPGHKAKRKEDWALRWYLDVTDRVVIYLKDENEYHRIFAMSWADFVVFSKFVREAIRVAERRHGI